MPMPRNSVKSKGAQLKRQGHTKASTGAYGTDPQARNKMKGSSVDLKR